MAKRIKTIAVDFDGVLHAYSKGWHDGTIYDKPVEGAAAAMYKLLELGYEVVIYSTRCYERTINGQLEMSQVAAMEQWLSIHGIPYNRIHVEPGKPLCRMFIDDNAYRFSGKWKPETVTEIAALDKSAHGP